MRIYDTWFPTCLKAIYCISLISLQSKAKTKWQSPLNGAKKMRSEQNLLEVASPSSVHGIFLQVINIMHMGRPKVNTEGVRLCWWRSWQDFAGSTLRQLINIRHQLENNFSHRAKLKICLKYYKEQEKSVVMQSHAQMETICIFEEKKNMIMLNINMIWARWVYC